MAQDQKDVYENLDFSDKHVLVVGDLMLDQYWTGSAERVSPEAPVPVVKVLDQDYRPGGAANVALNVVSLGARCTLIGFVGEDQAGRQLNQVLTAAGVNCRFMEIEDWPTPKKLRVMAQNQQLVRLDFEETIPISGESERFAVLLNQVEKNLQEADVMILEDYDKGVLQEPGALISASVNYSVPVVVDPKSKPLSEYRKADVVKPNEKEFRNVSGGDKPNFPDAARALCTELEIKNIVITLGEDGMSVNDSAGSYHVPARPVDVFDVTGAGDTAAAVMGLGLANGMSVQDFVGLANVASSLVIGKLGTAPISGPELKAGLMREPLGRGVLETNDLKEIVQQAKDMGETIVFTNGCFDILHAGHVTYLEEAAKLGDRLVVALNKDSSVARLKGIGRPIVKYDARALVVSGLESVDWVVGFDEDTPEALLETVQPDILVKGGDYSEDEVVGAEIVRSAGGSVRVLSLVEKSSTSHIVKRIKES